MNREFLGANKNKIAIAGGVLLLYGWSAIKKWVLSSSATNHTVDG